MRRLNSVERAWLVIGDHGSANAIQCFRVRGALNTSVLSKAFDALLQIYPILNSRIVGPRGRECFVPRESRPPCIEFFPTPCTRSQLESLVTEVLNDSINPRVDALVEFLVVTAAEDQKSVQSSAGDCIFWFVVNFHHSISDGRSKIAYISSFLKLCDAALISQEAFSQLSQALCGYVDLSPSLTDHFCSTGPLQWSADLVRFLSRRVLRETRFRAKILGPNSYNVPLRSSLSQKVWEPKIALDLRRTAKLHSLSVHSLLTAGLILAFREVCYPLEEDCDISCISFVNVRAQCEPPISDQALGCYISAAQSFHRMGTHRRLLPLAKEVSLQIQNACLHDLKPQATHAAFVAKALLAVGHRTVATLSVSNLGTVSPSLQSQSFRVEEVHVHSGLTGIGSTLSVGVITTDNALSMDLTYIEGVLSRNQVDNVATRTKQIMMEILYGKARAQCDTSFVEDSRQADQPVPRSA